MIRILTEPATDIDLLRMSRIFGDYIKLAVDVERGILAGGGEAHFECETALLKVGSRQQDIWGAGLNLTTRQIEYDSIINIRPSQGNRCLRLTQSVSDEIQDGNIRLRVNQIIAHLIGGDYAGN